MTLATTLPILVRRCLGSLLCSCLLMQCSQDEPKQREPSKPNATTRPGDQKLDLEARDVADLLVAAIAGPDAKSLDRVFFRISLEKPGKTGVALVKGSAWLSREGKARFSLQRGEEPIQLSFVSPAGVLRGTVNGPLAPAEENEVQRMQELTVLLQGLLCWDLLDPKVALSLGEDWSLESRIPATQQRSAHKFVRRFTEEGRTSSLLIDDKDYAFEGKRDGLHGSLPRRVLLPLARQTLNLEAWLSKAEFKPGLLDPKQQTRQKTGMVVGEEQENQTPTLREYGPIWEVAIQDPLDWERRVQILTQDIIQPFSDAGLGPAGLPSLTNNGKLLLHLRRRDGKEGKPRAPKGYRLELRKSRVSAVVYVTCTWSAAEKTLLAKLEPYIQKLGLRARGPLWMSPYIDWATVQEGPGPKQKIRIRGEIRVR